MVFHRANEPGALWLACISSIPCIHCSVFCIECSTLRAATEIFRDSKILDQITGMNLHKTDCKRGHGAKRGHGDNRPIPKTWTQILAMATGRSLMCLSGQTREAPRKAHMESDVLLQAKIRTHSSRLRPEFMSQFCTFQGPQATQKHFYVSCQCTSFRGCHDIQK